MKIKNEWKTLSAPAMKKTTPEAIENFSAAIVAIGGNVWEKNEHRRAYLPEWMDLKVGASPAVYAQPYDPYIDLNTGEFKFDVAASGWDSPKNDKTASDYWEMFRTLIRNEMQKKLNNQ